MLPPPPAPAADPLRDTLAAALGAQYELLVPIGRGAMGAVYLARERFLDRLVAVKVLPSALAGSADARERFLREARTAARLTHPHIVPLHTFGEAGDTLFYVMGYVDGESLEARLRSMTRLAPDEAARLLAEMADALHYAHAQGVVHRDIKPDNILLDRTTGRAMLADFGIARRNTEGATLTATGMVVGTPHYMSPEQAAGQRDIDGRSDLYALGVIGYRMLTGRLPFEGSNVMELLAQHMTRPAPPVVEPGVPAPLAEVVRRALAKDPASRWATGNAMRAALDAGDGDNPDELLPDELQGTAGMGVRAALIGAVLTEAAVVNAMGGFVSADFTNSMITMAVLAPAGMFALQLPRAVNHMGWRDAVALAFRQPRWWHGWWPARWRAARDIWVRLPAPIRLARTLDTCATVLSLCAVNGGVWLITRAVPTFGLATWLVIAGGLLPVALVVPAMWRVRRLTRARGLSMHENQRLITEPATGSSFWQRPEIAALLDAPPLHIASARALPRSPADHLRAIEGMDRSDGSQHRELFTDGVGAARELDRAIARCDAELAELARDVSPEERARIEASVAAQGAPADNESDAKQRMRALLGDQLTLLRGLEQRRSDLMARRERFAGHLHALWLGLATLRADAALDAAQASEITGRIRAIHREVEIRTEAIAETRALAP